MMFSLYWVTLYYVKITLSLINCFWHNRYEYVPSTIEFYVAGHLMLTTSSFHGNNRGGSYDQK